jgi:hypothetical protein
MIAVRDHALIGHLHQLPAVLAHVLEVAARFLPGLAVIAINVDLATNQVREDLATAGDRATVWHHRPSTKGQITGQKRGKIDLMLLITDNTPLCSVSTLLLKSKTSLGIRDSPVISVITVVPPVS